MSFTKFALTFSFVFALLHLSNGNALSPKEVDIVCITLHCGLQSTACFLDANCKKVLDCMGGCTGEGAAACQFVCQWEFGRNNEKYLNLLSCMGDNHCLTMDPDGICLGDADKTAQTVQSIDQVSGDWWILKGQNCGQDDTWNGGYDAYPCQQQSFVKLQDGNWVRNTTYCTGKDNVCTSPYINVQPEATVESPGVVKTTYTDPLYLKMVERWFIVEQMEEEWIFYFWCSENQAAADAGAVILGRQRNLDLIPSAVETRFREIANEYGLDYDAMCVNDNTDCPY